MSNESSKTATGRASIRLATAGKGHLHGAQQHLNDDVWDGLDSLPYFLTAADIRAVLNISKTESYRVAAACGPVRVGTTKRLVRITRARFFRYLQGRQEAA